MSGGDSLKHTRVAVIAARRTPIGRFLGSFADTSAVDLGVVAVRSALSEAALAPTEVDEVILGHARQAGVGPNGARQVAVRAGIPQTVPAMTINQACGSGLQTLLLGRDRIRLGEASVVLVGGMENMTRVPYLLSQARLGYRMGNDRVVDAMYQDGFFCPLAERIMGETAETLAERYAITREEQDRFAARSQNRAEAAIAAGRFVDELAPVTIRDRKGERVVDTDEHPRAGVTPESLAKLPPVFHPEGSVTAGNSSGITDGAAALVLMSEDEVARRRIPVLAWLEDGVTTGVDPAIMGIGPVSAVRRLEERTGRTATSYDLVELNEAFAAQVLAVDRELKFDAGRLNVNGGAIALGHPIGASGARIAVTLIREMVRRDCRTGLATLCVSGGLGLAASFVRGE
jgi:acetyl-CoA C-acetyltransferase